MYFTSAFHVISFKYNLKYNLSWNISGHFLLFNHVQMKYKMFIHTLLIDWKLFFITPNIWLLDKSQNLQRIYLRHGTIFLIPCIFAFSGTSIARMFQNQKHPGNIYGLPLSWAKWFTLQRKAVRIMKLVKGRCPFVNYVKFRISKKELRNAHRSSLENTFFSAILFQIRTEGSSMDFPQKIKAVL